MTQALHEPLEAPAVRETVQELQARIRARFPQRGLLAVCGDLLLLVEEVQQSSSRTHQRIRLARVASRVVMVLVLAGTAFALVMAGRDVVKDGLNSFVDLLPLIETAINDIVFAGIAVFFLWSFPERVQRGQLLKLLHQLRSTAHIIDMHQLTKDPEQLEADLHAQQRQQTARHEP